MIVIIITERERESRIAQLKSEIAKLEAITNRTSEQEAELNSKRTELARLEQQTQGGGGGDPNDPKKPNLTWLWILVVIVVLLVLGIIIYYLLKPAKKQEKCKN